MVSVANNAAILSLYFILFCSAVFTLFVSELNWRPSIVCDVAGIGVLFILGLKTTEREALFLII